MAGYLSGDSSSHHGVLENSALDKVSHDILLDEAAGHWYMSRKEIEDNSPSLRDGIDLKKETYLRKSYCTFLQDLGMRLKVMIGCYVDMMVDDGNMEFDSQMDENPTSKKFLMEDANFMMPQVTIATAIVFCHRFFLRHSHAKNDRRTIATACMFLAGKVEETPRPLKDVILVSYDIIHKKDPSAAQKIKQKEVYEQQKELILLGERVVLSTLAFDMNVHHPYKPLVEAIKKFKVAQNALAQVAWNFVNDGLRTSLCLQFKPHHIAAGAIFLAAKFLKVKLPSDGEKVWWQEFDVTPRQLEEVSNQMLELYEQNKLPQGSEIEGSSGAVHNQRGPIKASAVSDELVPSSGPVPAGRGSVSSSGKPGASKHTSSQSAVEHAQNHNAQLKTGHSNDDGSTEMSSVVTEHKLDIETKDDLHAEFSNNNSAREAPKRTETKEDQAGDNERVNGGRGNETVEAGEWRETGSIKPIVGRNLKSGERPVSQSPQDTLKTLDTDKWKAQAEKIRKSRLDITKKKDVVDEDDLIERELEDGVESAVEDERMKQERRQSWSENETQYHSKDHNLHSMNDQSSRGAHTAEEGEMLDDSSPMVNGRKRKGSPLDKRSESKHRREYVPGNQSRSDFSTHEDGHRAGRGGGYGEREHIKHT